ncbi:hypothetical protein [Desulfobacula sp.]|uniref:hypothetical protein n=1 Tax=Desulfobacula sp. TaxID=2593537 RepID=UPI0026066B44|nr:hypothetical protein [Desulfobacula sp.]
MNRQKLILLIVIMVVLMGVIAAVNHYYLQPKVLLTLPGVESVNLPEKIKKNFKSDLYAGTMEKILSDKGEQDPVSQLPTMVNRNPFLWIEESTDLAAGPDGSKGPLADETTGTKGLKSTETDASPDSMAQEFTLSMVIVGEARSLALVNNHFVSEGSKIGGFDVVKIEPQTVMLARKNSKKTLTLEPSGGPLQYHKAVDKKKTQEKSSPVNAPLDFQTQLKQVLKLYSDPNLNLK